MFARPEEVWQETFDDDQKILTQHLPNRELTLKIASRQDFLEQVDWANVIYFRGGITEKLMGELKMQAGWAERIHEKNYRRHLSWRKCFSSTLRRP
jgi:hypothetical protein